MKTKLFSLIALVATMLFTTSCEDAETVTYQPYTISVASSGSARALSDVSTYVNAQVANFQKTTFSGNMTATQAASLTNTFMDGLVSSVSAQGYRVFEGTQYTAKVRDSFNEVYTYTVSLTQNGAAAAIYSYVTVRENTPAGDLTAATAYIKSLLEKDGYTVITTTAQSPDNASYNVNNYFVYYKTFNTYDEAKADYTNNGKSIYTKLDASFINEDEDNWPSNMIYTGELGVVGGYYDENTGSGSKDGDSYNRQSPYWYNHRTWSTSDADAPFTTLTLTPKSVLNPPYLAEYSVSLDGVNSGLSFIQIGYGVYIADSSNNFKYIFQLNSTSEFQLTKIDGVAVTAGAKYAPAAAN